jgi:succinate dehydrogenase / fumarate reductase, flavoprotein subunit
MDTTIPVLIIGADITGMTAAIRLASMGIQTCLVTSHTLGRDVILPSFDGINGSGFHHDKDLDDEQFFSETTQYSGYLVNQKDTQEMCHKATAVINLCARLGVDLKRTREGHLCGDSVPGSRGSRMITGTVSLSRQLTTVLAQQVRFYAKKGLIQIQERTEFLQAIVDDNKECHGAILQDMKTMQLTSIRTQAVIMASAGIGSLFGRYSLTAHHDNVHAIMQLARLGAAIANPEFIDFSPLGCVGLDKSYLLSIQPLFHGARLWLHRESGKIDLLEGLINERPIYPHHVAQIMWRKQKQDTNISLDLTACTEELNEHAFLKLGNNIPVQPLMSDWLGGLWVDHDFMTNLRGLFAVGRASYQFKGAAVLPGNMLTLCMYGALDAVDHVADYVKNRKGQNSHLQTLIADVLQSQEKQNLEYGDLTGPENIYQLQTELADVMYACVGPVRKNVEIKNVLEKVMDLKQRLQRVSLTDNSRMLNYAIFDIRCFDNMLDLAGIIAAGSMMRNESRGVHHKSDYPVRDDTFLRTTKIFCDGESPKIYYEDVDTSLISPRYEDSVRERSAS